jgi:ATP-binding protein involved in chromosome partitioning
MNIFKCQTGDQMSLEKSCTNDSGPALKQEEKSREDGRAVLKERMNAIKNKVVVLSGKGGVGKSTVAVNLAMSLSLAGKRAGLLDTDIHGPSIPKMLDLEDCRPEIRDGKIIPIGFENLKVMSIGFLLDGKDSAVIWRGPMKMGVIEQFLRDVDWGELDHLVIDCPPGTGDEPLSVMQLIGDVTGAVIVTTPQEIALTDVRKSVNFCRQLNVPILGIVENMSGFACPKCGEVTEIFKSGGGKQLSVDMDVPFLGKIPIDQKMVEAGDNGSPFIRTYADTETAKAFGRVVRPILEKDLNNNRLDPVNTSFQEENKTMKIAIPLAAGRLAMHFGHCEQFALIDVDTEKKEITGKSFETPPAHEPGALPKWLGEIGATAIIAGGMGSRAQSLFQQNGIEVIVGAASEEPEKIVAAYLEGTLEAGDNICDH